MEILETNCTDIQVWLTACSADIRLTCRYTLGSERWRMRKTIGLSTVEDCCEWPDGYGTAVLRDKWAVTCWVCSRLTFDDGWVARRRCAGGCRLLNSIRNTPTFCRSVSVRLVGLSAILHSIAHYSYVKTDNFLRESTADRSYSSHAQSAAAAPFSYPWYAADDDKQCSISAESRINHRKNGTTWSTGMQFCAEVNKSRGHERLLFKHRLVTQEQTLTQPWKIIAQL